METSHAWIEYLNISTSDLEAWKNEAPTDVPLLVWCLKEGKIPFNDYAEWAKNHYALPVIRHEFFSNPPSLEDFEPTDWSPWMVPVGTWEGLTYIGCVMPPPDPVEGCIYLLADPSDLDRVYSTLKERTVSKYVPSPADAPEQEEPTHYEMPDGLILDLKSPMSSPPPPSEESNPSPEEPEAPAGLTVTLNLPPLSSPENPPSPPEEPLTLEEEPPAEFVAQSEEPVAQSEEPELTMSQVHVETETAETPEAAASAQPPGPSPTVPLPESALAGWWTTVQESFTHAVIARVNQDQFHVAWKDGSSMTPFTLSTSSPSLFRIALRTKKPYHGFVIENEVHSQFFKGIGVSGYPSCVTALYVDGADHPHIVSFFGFVGNDGSELSSAESLANALAEHLKSQAPTAQVA